MYQKLLVGYDGSEESLALAQLLVASDGALIGVSVFSYPHRCVLNYDECFDDLRSKAQWGY